MKPTASPRRAITHKVIGTVKWFNVKSGYGFITRNDTKEEETLKFGRFSFNETV